MAVEMGAEIGHAALRAMHEGQGALEARCGEDRPQGLAGLVGIDAQRLALEVDLAVLPALAPFLAFLDFNLRYPVFETLLLVL